MVEIYQRTMIDIMKASIYGEKFILKNNNINWFKFISEAKEHNISSLIYYTLDRSSLNNIEKKTLEKWKKEVMIENIIQVQHIKDINKIISDLKKRNIEIIVLKGLVLRKYYPKPELRSMSDSDILVKEEDLSDVNEYLIDNGYVKNNDDNDIHEGFMCPGKLEVELHWKLVNSDFIRTNISDFEENLWINKIKTEIDGEVTNTLGTEDFLIHLCLHMAVHIKNKGFGLRQLYDLSVYIKNNYDYINWTRFMSKISSYKLLKFTNGLLVLINKLFDIKIPDNIINNDDIKERDILLLLENILISGVYGKKNQKEEFSNMDRDNINISRVKRVINYIFPDKGYMTSRYSYAKKFTFLLPISWIHRIIKCIFGKYGVVQSIKFTRQTLKMNDIRKNVIKTFSL